MKLNRAVTIVALMAMLFIFVGSALAQSEVPPTTPPEQGTLTAALELIIKAITDATYVPIAAALVVALTGLAKHFLPEAINAGWIALTFQVILWVAWVLALHFGYAEQFGTAIQAFTTIITAVAGLIGSSIVATRVHESAAARNVPLAGYKRDDNAGSNV